MQSPLFLIACFAVSDLVAPPPAAAPKPAVAVDAGAASPDAGPKRSDIGAPPAPAAKPMEPAVKALVDRMQAFYEKTQDFTADFQQSYAYAGFKKVQQSSGKVTFRKPALMRWEYAKPSPKTFVLAGDKVYAHDPEAMTLTKASIATNQLSASVTFLWGQGKLADEFSIAKVACEKCTGVLLELTPLKPDPRFRVVRLEVDPVSAQVVKSVVVDPDGSTNSISFGKLTTNAGIDEKAFKLSPPEGTQVVDYTAPHAPAPAPKP